MSLQAFLEWFTQGAIVLLAVIVLVQWVRWRDRVSFDILLVFGSLAILLILERTLRLAQLEASWIRPLGYQRAPRASVPADARRLAFPAGIAQPCGGSRPSAWRCRSPPHGWRKLRSPPLIVFAFRVFRVAARVCRVGVQAGREGGGRRHSLADAARGLGRTAARDSVRARGARLDRAGRDARRLALHPSRRSARR